MKIITCLSQQYYLCLLLFFHFCLTLFCGESMVPLCIAFLLKKEGFPGGSVLKNLPANAGDVGSIPGLGRFPWVGNGYPLQYSCLENSTDRGAWLAAFHGVEKSWTWLSDWAVTHAYKKCSGLLKIMKEEDRLFLTGHTNFGYYFFE